MKDFFTKRLALSVLLLVPATFVGTITWGSYWFVAFLGVWEAIGLFWLLKFSAFEWRERRRSKSKAYDALIAAAFVAMGLVMAFMWLIPMSAGDFDKRR